MKVKSATILLLVLCSLSVLPLVIAQNEASVNITAGGTTEKDILTIDEQPHNVLGAIVSAIESQYKRWISYKGTKIYSEEKIDRVNDFFCHYLFPP